MLHNMTSSGPVWPVVVNCGQLWWRISSLIVLVHFKAELRDLGLLYQVIACTALWYKIGQISSKVAYNSQAFVTVSRYDILGPYMFLCNLLWEVLALSVRFDHIKIKETFKLESGQKWSIIKQYELLWRDMTNCGLIRHRFSNSDQFSTSATEKATYGLWCHLVANTAKYGIYWSRMICCRQWWPTMVKNIKFARISPLQGRMEGPRSSTSGYSMYGTVRQNCSNLI